MTVDEAERAIAAILRELESSLDYVVDGITIADVEITTMHDDRRQLERRVFIELRRLPGQRWAP